MPFEIPSRPLSDFNPDALRRMRAQAAEEYNAALALARQNPSEVTDEQLTGMEALAAFTASVDEHLTTLATDAETGEEGETAGDTQGRLNSLTPVTDPDPAPAAGSEGADPAGDPPTVADVAGRPLVAGRVGASLDAVMAHAAITASAGVPGYAAGQELADLGAVADAAQVHLRTFTGMSGGSAKNNVAVFTLPATEFVARGDRGDLEVMDQLLDESRLPGGSLVAARTQAVLDAGGVDALTASAGWCAPSQIDLTVRFYGAASGLVDLPTMTATRGGVWIMPEINFATVYGTSGANYFNLTEAQVAGGSTKSFVEIDCPTPTEYRLGVTGFGVVGNLLQLRGYPEYVREYIRAAQIGLQHLRSTLNIAALVTGSTAVDLSAVATPWTNDGSVISVVLPMSEMAAVDQRYRSRLEPTATVEQIFPIWLMSAMRADWMRRNGVNDPFLAESMIMGWFRERYIAPMFVYGWQDFFAAGSGPGAATPIQTWPATVKFLSYPAGTWVNAVADVITLSTVYDSVRLASNQRVEFFTEQGNKIIKRRTDSRVYTATICPNGSTGVQRAVACA